MNLNASMQAVKDLFRFPFRDPRWPNKLLIGSLLGFASMIVPILPGLPLMGYMARLMRAGANNTDPERLPEWDNWDELFVDGLRQFGVLAILMLVPVVIIGAGWTVYMGVVMAMPFLEGRGGEGAAVFSIMSAAGVMFLAMAVGMLLLLGAGLLLPPASAHVAVKREFGAFFRVREWWAILRANLGSFLVAWAVFGVLYTVLIVVIQILYLTLVLCLLIPFVILPVGVYSAWVMYRLIGQAYGQGSQEPAAPAEMPSEATAPAPGL